MMLSVREIQVTDIELIANYWLDSDDDFLVSMGVDLTKVPTRDQLTSMLKSQISSPYEEKASYALIWELDGKPIGHCNVNSIVFETDAYMHIHIWDACHRQKGFGLPLIKLSLPYFFICLALKSLYCEPYAKNDAPNITLEKLGFEFVKQHVTIPGSLNFEQEVKRWVLTQERFKEMNLNTNLNLQCQ